MQILGKNGRGFIMQVDERDAYNLIGHSSQYASGKKLNVGDSIKVSEMYDRLVNLKNNEAHLEKAAALLRASAELLEMALPAVHRANSTEKKKLDGEEGERS